MLRRIAQLWMQIVCCKLRLQIIHYLLGISNIQYRVLQIERQMIQSRMFRNGYFLTAYCVIFIQFQIKHVNLAIQGGSSKYGTRIRCPSNVSNMGIKIEHKKGFAERFQIKPNEYTEWWIKFQVLSSFTSISTRITYTSLLTLNHNPKSSDATLQHMS